MCTCDLPVLSDIALIFSHHFHYMLRELPIIPFWFLF